MALDLSTLIQGLGAVSQGVQQGGAQSFEARQQQEQAQRQQQQLESLNQLRDLRSQGLQQSLAPVGQPTLEAFAQQRGMSTEQFPQDSTLGQLGVFADLFPPREEVDDEMRELEKKVKQSQVDLNKARAGAARSLKNKRGGTETLNMIDTAKSRWDSAVQELVRTLSRANMMPSDKVLAARAAMQAVREAERDLRNLGVDFEPFDLSRGQQAPQEPESGRGLLNTPFWQWPGLVFGGQQDEEPTPQPRDVENPVVLP